MKTTLTSKLFLQKRREMLLEYKSYREEFASAQEGYDIAQEVDLWPQEKRETIPFAARVTSRRRYAWDALDQLTLAYSAGHDVDEMSEFYPAVLAYWEEYAKWDKAWDESPQSEGAWVAHLPLLGSGFAQANRLICFGILLGHGHLLPRLMPIVDYRNPRTDGMLERLVAFHVAGRGTPPDDCMRHLPYFKTLKIFAAKREKRAQLMAKYLADWYHASRHEPYHDSHKRGVIFLGYWSWEAAAITYLLDIDDSSYRDAQFYPRDLVDFARKMQAANAHPASTPLAPDELRAKAGEPCPLGGQWRSIDSHAQTRSFQQGELMADLGSRYGLTVWQFFGKS